MGRFERLVEPIQFGRDFVFGGLEHAFGQFGFAFEGGSGGGGCLSAIAAFTQKSQEVGRPGDAGRIHDTGR